MSASLPSEDTCTVFSAEFPHSATIVQLAQRHLNFLTDRANERVDLCNKLRRLIIEMPVEGVVTYLNCGGVSWDLLTLYLTMHSIKTIPVMETDCYWRFYTCDKIVRGDAWTLKIHLTFRHISEIELLNSGLPTV
jgi:hypothetical protein